MNVPEETILSVLAQAFSIFTAVLSVFAPLGHGLINRFDRTKESCKKNSDVLCLISDQKMNRYCRGWNQVKVLNDPVTVKVRSFLHNR
jgi:hypothetical protein